MAELIDEIPLPGGLTKRVYSDGAVRVVNSEGRFVSHPESRLPPEAARRIARGREIKKSLTFQNDVDNLLSELELDSLAARRLAELFVEGGSGAVSAARELFRMSRKYNPPPPPTASQEVLNILVDPAMRAILFAQVTDRGIVVPDGVLDDVANKA